MNEVTQEMTVTGTDFFCRNIEDRFPESWPADLFVKALYEAMRDTAPPGSSAEPDFRNESAAPPEAPETGHGTFLVGAEEAPSQKGSGSNGR